LQRVKERKLGLIEGLPASIAYGEKAEPAASTLRPQTARRNEQCDTRRYELPPLHSILIAV
jgi:hypothetical protein